MVQSKSDRERQKLITDKCQSLIEVLLKDEDNKYCVDCDAKGPRWASWNLGIFLCIRCAGIHRNLGVHISKVKSVNLDAWTPEHVAYVQRMGNSRARAIYEANLPDDFRRPQTDTALESFIRAKYEHKRYIAQDYVDPGPPAPAFNIDDEIKRLKEQKRGKISGLSTTKMLPVSELVSKTTKPQPNEAVQPKPKAESAASCLVDLDLGAATEDGNKSNKSALDLLLGFDLNTSAASEQKSTPKLDESNPSLVAFDDSPSKAIPLDLDFLSASTNTTNTSLSSVQQPATTEPSKVLTKESILSLYSFSPSTSNPGQANTTDPFGMMPAFNLSQMDKKF